MLPQAASLVKNAGGRNFTNPFYSFLGVLQDLLYKEGIGFEPANPLRDRISLIIEHMRVRS